MMLDKPTPCPFCKSEPNIVGKPGAFGVCCTCDGKRFVHTYGKTRAEAVESWNERANLSTDATVTYWKKRALWAEGAEKTLRPMAQQFMGALQQIAIEEDLEAAQLISCSALSGRPAIDSQMQGPNFGSHASSVAMFDIIAERLRQQDGEGWTPEHDDLHDDFSLAKAASVYAACATAGRPERAVMDQFGLSGVPAAIKDGWPLSWKLSWLKPTSRRRDLVKSAALIVAEIERLDRAAIATSRGSAE